MAIGIAEMSFPFCNLIYGRFGLEHRLGIDDDVSRLGFLAGVPNNRKSNRVRGEENKF